MDERLREYLRSFTVLVEPDDIAAVRVIPSAHDDILVELTLKAFGSLARANPPGLVGEELKLHFNRKIAVELARQILAITEET
jgi:hypothetical protein